MEIRVDRSQLPRMTKTREGYLRGDAIVTRTGVFEYMNADGTVRRELRHPDDILNADSLASLSMIPVTVNHPGALVTSDNASTFSVGLTGENVRVEGGHVVAPLTITHKDGIEAVRKGKRELSLGYTLELVQEDGIYEGEPYSHRQKNVSYNHLAIVDTARAGRAARLNLDGASVQIVEIDPEEQIMLKVNIDGIQYDAAPEVGRHIEKLNAELARALADVTSHKTRADRSEAERDTVKLEAEKLRADAADTTAFNNAVNTRIDLLSRASRVVKLDRADYVLSNRDVMTKAIKSVHKDLNLDGKSDDYVSACFDLLDSKTQGGVSAATALGGPIRGDATRGDAAAAEKAAWDKSIVAMNSWRDA